jgi:hypothetical protein
MSGERGRVDGNGAWGGGEGKQALHHNTGPATIRNQPAPPTPHPTKKPAA